MIPLTQAERQLPAWRAELAAAIRDPAELIRELDLDSGLLPAAQRAAARFPLRVPRAFVARMRRRDPDDPLLRQVLPLGAECLETEGFSADPVGDLPAMRGGGLVHKYDGRALLIVTGACAVNCRYCFRREFPYAEQQFSRGRLAALLDTLRADTSIREIILSGGDPLSLPDARLAQLVAELEAIGHLRRLRIHTRLPIVIPSRVDAALLSWLSNTRLQSVLVVHCNHPGELDESVLKALTQLRSAGVTLLNQAVLLAGVNASVEVQVELSERLFEAGVLPYYLHLLDRVRGTAHFEVPEAAAILLYRDLAGRLPGFLLPRLARETAGADSKLFYGLAKA